jgi:nitrogen fixation/metabolism regulation signal transduction histidine kinase
MEPAMKHDDRPKRLWRNYLLDRGYQLKFTGYLVLTALAISVLLGAFMWRGSRALLVQAEEAVNARSRAAETSRELGNVALSSKLLDASDDPSFAAQLQERSRAIDAQFEQERAAVEAQRAELMRQERRTWLVLLAALLGFTLLIAAAGIVATHRIAGPVHRMKRMAGAIGAGQLVVPTHGLRARDELHDLLDALTAMVQGLRACQNEDLEWVVRAKGEAERAGQPAVAALLGELEARLRGRLG